MEEKLTNYRNVYKSDHLGVIDLEELLERGSKLIFTIKQVTQHNEQNKITVAGKKIVANICHFEEPIKPLVVNSTNGKTLKMLSGSAHIEKWTGMKIQLYIDANVTMAGGTVGGVRIMPTAPVIEKPIFTKANFEKAKTAKADINRVKEIYQVTPEVEQEYIEYYGSN